MMEAKGGGGGGGGPKRNKEMKQWVCSAVGVCEKAGHIDPCKFFREQKVGHGPRNGQVDPITVTQFPENCLKTMNYFKRNRIMTSFCDSPFLKYEFQGNSTRIMYALNGHVSFLTVVLMGRAFTQRCDCSTGLQH